MGSKTTIESKKNYRGKKATWDDDYCCDRTDCKYYCKSFVCGVSNSCDYFSITGQIRGGSCKDCDKYEVGDGRSLKQKEEVIGYELYL